MILPREPRLSFPAKCTSHLLVICNSWKPVIYLMNFSFRGNPATSTPRTLSVCSENQRVCTYVEPAQERTEQRFWGSRKSPAGPCPPLPVPALHQHPSPQGTVLGKKLFSNLALGWGYSEHWGWKTMICTYNLKVEMVFSPLWSDSRVLEKNQDVST